MLVCTLVCGPHCSPGEGSLTHAVAGADAQRARAALLLSPCRYLEEVGYTDTILDMRSKRVRSLLGRSLELNGAAEPSEGGPRAALGPAGLSGGESLLVKQIEEQIKR